ncbi:MAG: radical SAM/SPASM domain-containing protein [Magnetococcales bacterium]|nr:radical SAM/SPASM domain-containing protein [Magnetococcales bacterium]
MQTPLTSINFSLSAACGASCIYCPSERGKAMATKNMPFAVARKIIDEVNSPEFVEKYQVVKYVVGENGDSFINKEALDILRYIKHRNPKAHIFCVTNFQQLTPEKSATILAEGLISSLCLNIDGSDPERYQAVKGLAYQEVLEEHFRTFLRIRESVQSPVPIHLSILSMHNYLQAVQNRFHRLPTQLRDAQATQWADDTEEVRARWAPLLRPGDVISRMRPMFWAERALVDKTTLDYSTYRCPLLKRIRSEAFIAPDGTWYACCFDDNYRLALGNVYQQSVDAVACSPAREELIGQLEAQAFARIGPPCDTVNCCWT